MTCTWGLRIRRCTAPPLTVTLDGETHVESIRRSASSTAALQSSRTPPAQVLPYNHRLELRLAHPQQHRLHHGLESDRLKPTERSEYLRVLGGEISASATTSPASAPSASSWARSPLLTQGGARAVWDRSPSVRRARHRLRTRIGGVASDMRRLGTDLRDCLPRVLELTNGSTRCSRAPHLRRRTAASAWSPATSDRLGFTACLPPPRREYDVRSAPYRVDRWTSRSRWHARRHLRPLVLAWKRSASPTGSSCSAWTRCTGRSSRRLAYALPPQGSSAPSKA